MPSSPSKLPSAIKFAIVGVLSFVGSVMLYLAGLMNASFAFSVGQEWRTPIANRWAYAAAGLFVVATGCGLASLWLEWRVWRAQKKGARSR